MPSSSNPENHNPQNSSPEDFLLEDINQRLEKRLQSFPILNSLRQSLGREVNQLLQDKTLNTRFRNLATGESSLEQSLLQLTSTATKIINTAMRDEKRVSITEARANLQYRAALLKKMDRQPQQSFPNRRGAYVLRGQVLHAQTQEPLSGLVIEAIDRDISKHDFLGIDVTDKEGRFEIVFRAKDFKESGENLPEVLLQIGLDRKTPLHLVESAVALKPEEPANITLSLPEEAVTKAMQMLEQGTKNYRLDQVDRITVFNQIQHTQITELGKILQQGLDSTTHFLENQIKSPDSPHID